MTGSLNILLLYPTAVLTVETVFLAIALVLLLPISVLFIECSAALLSNKSFTWDTQFSRPRIAVLVPAHNEAAGINKTLQTLLPQLTQQDRLIVIADNCDDSTATVSQAAGATVIERQEPDRRGKGYALDYGLQFLASDPPDVVVVIDADCTVHSDAVSQIACLAAAKTRPVQANYLLASPVRPSAKEAVSLLAFTVKNFVRPVGLHQLNLPCLLTGTGMAFPWTVIRAATLASSNIVEDMQLALDLSITGYPPIFCSTARVTGQIPQQQHAAKSQRTRWEHGHIQTLLTQVPRLIEASIHQKRFDLLAIALDLCIPPLSLLVILWAFATGSALLAAHLLSSSSALISLLGIEGLLIFLAIFVAWFKFSRTDLPIRTLLGIPLYILWKLPLYLAFLVQPQKKWIRTERDVIDTSES
jgi:cellulose synthase/poly-beta-1,6-N-acetylglucosamine synthase-like glycosyltransferase